VLECDRLNTNTYNKSEHIGKIPISHTRNAKGCVMVKKEFVKRSNEGRMGNALALRGEEGRDKLR
jgi:hypothetical protein